MLDRSVPPFDHRMCNWEPDAHAAAEANPRDSVATPRMFVMVATEGVDSAKVHTSRASLAAADDSKDPTIATLATANKIERIGTLLSLIEEGGAAPLREQRKGDAGLRAGGMLPQEFSEVTNVL